MSVVNELIYLCRLCATKTGILLGLPIFDGEGGENLRNIDKKIAACLPVQVSMNDELPKVVCEECAFKLDEIFDFREKCLETEHLFMGMLKRMKDKITQVNDTFQNQVNEIPEIQRIHDNISNINSEIVHNNIDNIGDSVCIDKSEDIEVSTIHTVQVIEEMDSDDVAEQVVGPGDIEEQEEDIEVTFIDCLDGDTVRMVDEHIREVADHQIAMHLENDITVVGHLGINDVTAIGSESPDEIVHYCDNNAKYETIPVKEEYNQQLHKRLTVESGRKRISQAFEEIHEDNERNGIVENSLDDTIISIKTQEENPDIPSTSRRTVKNREVVATEYTKYKKHSLLETILNNPTIDETGTNWYICSICNEAATEPNNLAEHFDEHFLSCTCGLFFINIDDLNNHKQFSCNKNKEVGKKEKSNNKNEKSKDPMIHQPLNEDSSITDDNKKVQINGRQKWTPKVCSQCGKQYRTNYKLQEHMRKHTGEKPFQCLLCDKAFRSKIGLAQHTATHTGQFDYSCSTCGKGFQCKSYLIVHQRVHSDLKPYPCNTCGQNFKTKQSLLDHQNRHLGVKPYMCEVCGRGFITKGLCKSHQKIHSGMDNRQYPCEVCNKMFVSKSYLNTHLRIHTGEKPYLCEVCGKGFLTRVDLKIHSTMHTGEKSFKCEMCNKVFARRAALRCHRRSHTGERPYRCDVCGKTFTQFSPMAIHKRLHTGERPYPCDICGKAFVSRSTMMCHKKKNHSTTVINSNQQTEEEVGTDNNGVIIQETDEMIMSITN